MQHFFSNIVQVHCYLKLCCTATSLTDLNIKPEEKCNGGKWFSLPLPTVHDFPHNSKSSRSSSHTEESSQNCRIEKNSTFLLTEWAGHIPEKGIMDESQTRGRINEMKGRQIPIILLSPLSGIGLSGLEIEKQIFRDSV